MKLLYSLFFLICCILVSCESTKDNMQIKSEIVATMADETNSRSDSDNFGNEKLLFTGDDIAWFNPKTRELRFKNITPSYAALPMGAQINMNIGNETLFTVIHLTAIVSAAYNDLVLYYDHDDKAYYLHDCYPSSLDTEYVQRNREKRAPGWNKFINQLKVEGKIK